MAKNAGVFSKWVNSIPAEAEFTITMAADSTTAVYGDIDTGIDDKQAWAIYGVEFWFQTIATPGVPLAIHFSNTIMQFQIHRNDDNTALINPLDKECLCNWGWEHGITTSGNGQRERVIRIPFREVTMQPTLRALFVTQADNTTLSATTVELAGRILYDTIPAPAGTATKIGQLSDL